MAPQIQLHEHRIQNLWDCPGHVRNHIQSPLQSHPDSGMVHSLLMNRIICRVPLYRRLPGFDNLASLIQVHCLSEPSYHPHLLPAAGKFHSFSECQSWHALSYLPESQVWTHNMAQAGHSLLSLIPAAQPCTSPAGNRRPLCVSDGHVLWSVWSAYLWWENRSVLPDAPVLPDESGSVAASYDPARPHCMQ